MRKALKVLAISLMILLTAAALRLGVNYTRGKLVASHFYDAAGVPLDYGARAKIQPVKRLQILPVVEYYSSRETLKTENGLSYLIRADETDLLMDLGKAHDGDPDSPLLHNLERLGIDPAGLDALVVTHPHDDHLGGRVRTTAPFAGKTVYVTQAHRQARARNVEVKAPGELAPGVGTTGPVPIGLLTGLVTEQALVVDLEGKGLVVLIGCGHPGVEALVEYAEQVYDRPVYAVFGGFHLPVTGDRTGTGLNMQNLLGRPKPFTQPASKEDVANTIEYLQRKNVQVVGLSPHDSCDWTVEQFALAFGERFRKVAAGLPIILD